MPAKYDKETKAKAVRLVVDHVEDYASERETIKTVSSRLGMTTETLRRWVCAKLKSTTVTGRVSSAERAEIRELKRRNRELEQTVEILKAAAGFFARESDPRLR